MNFTQYILIFLSLTLVLFSCKSETQYGKYGDPSRYNYHALTLYKKATSDSTITIAWNEYLDSEGDSIVSATLMAGKDYFNLSKTVSGKNGSTLPSGFREIYFNSYILPKAILTIKDSVGRIKSVILDFTNSGTAPTPVKITKTTVEPHPFYRVNLEWDSAIDPDGAGIYEYKIILDQFETTVSGRINQTYIGFIGAKQEDGTFYRLKAGSTYTGSITATDREDLKSTTKFTITIPKDIYLWSGDGTFPNNN